METPNDAAAGAPPVTPATTPAPTPSFEWVKDDGAWGPGALEKLGYKDNPTLATIPGPKVLAKAYLDLKGMMGKKFVRPSGESTPEEIAEWRGLVGAPEAPEAYGSLLPDGFGKEGWDPELEKGFLALAHAEHLTPDAAKKIARFHAEHMKAAEEKNLAAFKSKLDAGEADLQKEWGQDYSRKDANFKALAAYMKIPLDHDIFFFPEVKKAFAEHAPSFLGGDKIVHGETIGISGGLADQMETVRLGPDYQGHNGSEKQKAAANRLRSLADALEKSNGG